MEEHWLARGPEALLKEARDALSRGEHEQALQKFALVMVLSPKSPKGYCGAGECLREMKLLDQADAILLRGLEFFPNDPHLSIAYSWVSGFRGDWAQGASRFSNAYLAYPQLEAVRHGFALALYYCNRLAEARSVLVQGGVPSATSAVYLVELLARIALKAGDGDAAIEHLNSLVAAHPAQARQHLALIDGLRQLGRSAEMEAAIQAALAQLGDDFQLLVALAQAAQFREDWGQALQRWEVVKTLFPGAVDGYMGCAVALRGLGRPKEADVLLGPALRVFSDHLGLLILSAQIAGQLGKVEEAQKRWRWVQTQAPDRLDGFVGEVQALAEGQRVAEAEGLLRGLMAKFPANLALATEFANMGRRWGTRVEAIQRWRTVAEQFSASEKPVIELTGALLADGRLDEALQVAQAGFQRFPNVPELHALLAEVAAARQDWAESERLWRQLLKDTPHFTGASLGLGRMLHAAGRAEEAFQLLNDHRPQGAAAMAFDLVRAKILIQVRDWPTAFGLLVAMKQAAPAHGGVKGLITEALWQAGQDVAIDASGGLVIPEILLRTDEDEARELKLNRQLLIQFESLGDSCEFGMLQRRFGAEPLSLLRWTGTPPEGLALALANRLAGIGEPQFTQLKIVPQGSEYTTYDLRYQMFSHTFTPSFSVPEEKFFSAHCKRMQFMRNKLLDDFKNGEKVFVYGSAKLNEENIAKLHMAARTLGDRVTLLCVRLASDDHPAGTLKQVVPGLLVGAVSRFSTVNIAVDEWLNVCSTALTLTGRAVEV